MINDILKGKSKEEIENSIALFSKVIQFEILFKYYYSKERDLNSNKIQNLIKTSGLRIEIEKIEDNFDLNGNNWHHRTADRTSVRIYVTDRDINSKYWEELILDVSFHGVYTKDHRKGQIRSNSHFNEMIG